MTYRISDLGLKRIPLVHRRNDCWAHKLEQREKVVDFVLHRGTCEAVLTIFGDNVFQ
jgi:hypothetical protein